jgi:UDP-N-acetylglucosamine transferase subunit ALG13
MIFATVGSAEPFERLMEALCELPATEELVIQSGASRTKPANALCVPFMSFDDVAAHIASARVVIAHAGVGTVMTVLQHGKRPLVVPRLANLGEAVDDHQTAFARRLDDQGLVTLVEDAAELASLVNRPIAGPPRRLRSTPLEQELRRVVQEVVGDPSAQRVTGG